MNNVTLYPHQNKALELTRGKNKVAYYLDMGLGKTFVASEKMVELNNPYTLIVCPKSLIDTWVKHLTDNYPYLTIRNFSNHKHNNLLNSNVGVINYDLVWRRPELLKLKDFTLILDESSYIKNDSSKRTKFIMKMKPSSTILLSGTPTGGKYEELYTQAKLLGINTTKKAYWDKYIRTVKMDVGGFKIDKVVGYRNVDDLKATFRKHGAVFMQTQDVFELPAQVETVYKCKCPSIYKKFMRDRIITIDDVELVGDTQLNMSLYLRQLSSQYNKHKLETLKDLIEGTNDRLIIFYNFKKEYELIKELTDRPLSVVNGDTHDLSAYDMYDNSITLIQYQAGSMGLNLQKANKIIYFSLTRSAEQFMQSKKRTNRIGQTRTCFYYYLITENTIEEDIKASLDRREDYNIRLFID